jgi:hypothetical protein
MVMKRYHDRHDAGQALARLLDRSVGERLDVTVGAADGEVGAELAPMRGA